MPAPEATRYRRAPHLVSYWRNSDLIVRDYVSRSEIATAPALFELLHFLDRWRSFDAVRRRFRRVDPASLRRAIDLLVRVNHLERSDRRAPKAQGPLRSPVWMPEPAAFHFSTKDVDFVDIDAPIADGVAPTASRSTPPPVKRYPGRRLIPLNPIESDGELPRVLKARRTWRRFGDAPIALDTLGQLVGLTWGVQHWVDVAGRARMALKTSPSGGARHSIEAYVVALRVKGLPRGLYHYSADRHALVPLRRGADAQLVARYLPVQPGYSSAAALIVMTSVFDRVIARYPYPRAYRSVLVEAGHLCQTFLLLATSRGLAPFCSMAFADSTIERDLGIDGSSEAALYVAGVGSRPAATDWAPWADPSLALPTRSTPRRRTR